MSDDGATDETLAAPKLAHGTTRTVGAGQLTRASSPSLAETVAPAPQDLLPIVERSNYQILGELARGGMGRILEAHDLRLDRPIAIKEVLHGDEGARARFDREVRITAGLQHPAIVHVTEAGRWPSGQPFFAMKLIRGKPLDVRIEAATSLTDRLALLPAVIAVTDALAYAHSKHVIHRDLKPANVLVGDFGETVVIDWGIAKDLSDTEEIVSLHPSMRTVHQSGGAETVEGSVMGTPSYMPPEQAQGDRVDARADVYALGALLYQVLAGVPPYVGRTTAEVLAKVLTEAPAPLATIVPEAPVDLIAVVEKAMARTAADRFPTANEMVAELKRFQQGMLVKSHDYTPWQLAKRWVNRNRGAVLVGAVAIAVLIALGAFGLSRIIDERRNTEVEATEARTQADIRTIAEAKRAVETDPTEAVAILKRLHPETSQLRAARMIASDAAAGGVAHVLEGNAVILGLAFSPDGSTLASFEEGDASGSTGLLRVWDLATWTGRVISGASDLLAIGFDGQTIRGFDRSGRIWEWSTTQPGLASPRLVRTLAGEGDWVTASWSPTATRVAVFQRDLGHRFITRLADLKTDDRFVGDVTGPVWTADGRAILAHDRKAKIVVRYDVATGETTRVLSQVEFPGYAGDTENTWVSRDVEHPTLGELAYLRHLPSKMRVPTGRALTLLTAVPGGRVVGTSLEQRGSPTVETLRSSAKGKFLLFDPSYLSNGDHSLVVSDGWPGSLTHLAGHDASVDAIVVSSRGAIASGDRSGEIRVWTMPVAARDHGDNHATSTFAAVEGDRLIVTRRGPRLEVRDLVAGGTRMLEISEVAPGIQRDLTVQIDRGTPVGERRIREIFTGPDHEVIELARSRDGRHVATVDDGEHVVVWDLVSGRGKLLADRVVHVAINRDGTRIATSRQPPSGSRRVIEEWDVATGTPVRLGEMNVSEMLYGPDDRLAVATDAHRLYVFRGRKPDVHVLPIGQNYRALAFSPDGRHLFLGSDTWVIEALDLVTAELRHFQGHQGTVVALRVDRAGKRLFSGSADNTVRVWNIQDGSSTVLRGHTALVTSIEEGHDNTLLTASFDGTARLWDLENLHSRALRGHEDRVLVAGHVAGGQRIVVVDIAHQIAEYADHLPHDEQLLRSWLAAATNKE